MRNFAQFTRQNQPHRQRSMKSNRTTRLHYRPLLLLALAAFALSGCDDSSSPLKQQKGQDEKLSSANWKDIKAKAAASQAKNAAFEAEMEKKRQRIDFTQPALPDFIESVEGLSFPEPWGRWTDAAVAPTFKINFKEALPNTFLLELRGSVAGPIVGKKFKLQAGPQTIEFSLSEQDARRPQSVIMRVAGAKDLKVLEIIPPETVIPRQVDPAMADDRQLALAVVSLMVTRLPDQAPAPATPAPAPAAAQPSVAPTPAAQPPAPASPAKGKSADKGSRKDKKKPSSN